ncbi:MAG: cation diffusion facilitator family transporter [Bacteroidales bacterium]
MGHNHSSHSHQHNHSQNASKNIIVAFVLNSVFVVIELVGGILTNSIAILSDAMHDFGDCISLGIAWGLQKKSQQKRDEFYSYGYKCFSLLGSVFLSGILTISSLFVIYEAVKRIVSPQQVHAQGMLWLAILGILINGAAALRLKKGSTLNEKAVFLHIMEDVLGWVAVLLVSITMLFVNIPVLDPLLSIAISLWVLSNVYKNMRDTFKILLQAIPTDVDVKGLQQKLEGIDGIVSIHDLHVWTLDGVSHVMTLHVVTPLADLTLAQDTCQLKKQVDRIGSEFGITHITIEFEKPGADCTYINDCRG